MSPATFHKTPSFFQDLNADIYHGPVIAAECLVNYFDEEKRPTAKIIDIAAGTGHVGVEVGGVS